ncbi:putative membrane protein [Yersinia rochesterensis]|uniref:MFS transporter n=1 Tax=Yersinia rochesterensis TaxID=1604335 RepID=A0A386HE49_9GAMM|nr:MULTISPECIES: peptidase [Yersinia]AJI87871.1 putative membrane protein [Yersinia frederiksenii Y225]CNH37474.1 putative Zn-dependent protease [Yersinia kristensenii]AIN20122.1 putative membrane protein [Yersinia rochesterensis]AJJ37820.1 putative membrane protein [Yersinia rochesterensis]AYD44062.1 MFS transporter [Yersinia rochesterensis]
MIQIALLLFGADFVRTKSKYLWFIGFLWGIAGSLIFIDGLDGQLYFPLKTFGFFLILESLITLSVASSGVGSQKAVLYFKGGIFFFSAVIIILNQTYSNLLLSIIFGFAYFIIGLFVGVSAWVVRFPHWRTAAFYGLVQIIFAFFLFIHSQATISFFLGFLMIDSGYSCLKMARRTSQMKRATSVFQLMQPTDILIYESAKENQEKTEAIIAENTDLSLLPALIVHIWTPEGSANNRPVPRPVINRYIAAVDETGVISTGHAALEAPPDVYISLYPAEDLDRSPSEFFRLLKATRDNDVKGMFQPSYAVESANWCDSDRRISFRDYNIEALSNFWQSYRREESYNLTYRNCSSSVAYALEAALDGVLSPRSKNWLTTFRVFFMPELWIAAQVRKRALMMAWTPGLVMDYARALSAIVQPVPQPWHQRMPWKVRGANQNTPQEKE